MEHTSTEKRDFGVGSVSAAILRLAIPMTFAQLINVLYSVVDRIYIGHLPHTSTEALTGIGLTLPVITIVTAFANLFGMGGAPLFSMERGRENTDKARTIMGNSFALILIFGLLLSLLCYLFKEPLLYLFGASDTIYPYADAYLSIYLLGTIFVMISLGMNNFINAQGFGVMGMLTVSIGAVLNLILDPVFIFIFGLGILGRRCGYRYFSDDFRPLGLKISYRQKGTNHPEQKIHADQKASGQGHYHPGTVRIYHVHYERCRTDHLQCYFAELRRRSVYRDHDRHQFSTGDRKYPCKRIH